MAAEIILYTRETKVANLDAMPRGLGLRYLEVIRDHTGAGYIAQQWRKKLPAAGIVLDLNGPEITAANELRARGAELLKAEDRFGDTKTGWWMDGVYLAPTKNAVHALDVLEGR